MNIIQVMKTSKNIFIIFVIENNDTYTKVFYVGHFMTKLIFFTLGI